MGEGQRAGGEGPGAEDLEDQGLALEQQKLAMHDSFVRVVFIPASCVTGNVFEKREHCFESNAKPRRLQCVFCVPVPRR